MKARVGRQCSNVSRKQDPINSLHQRPQSVIIHYELSRDGYCFWILCFGRIEGHASTVSSTEQFNRNLTQGLQNASLAWKLIMCSCLRDME